MKNFQTRLWKHFQELKEAPAILRIDGDGKPQTESFWQWTRSIQNVAMALLEKGFKPGTRVGLIGLPRDAELELVVATWLLGGCAVPLPGDLERKGLLHCLARSGCTWIAVTDEATRSDLRGPGGDLPDHLKWLITDLDEDASSDPIFALQDLYRRGRHLIQRGKASALAKRIYGLKPRDPALIFFEPTPQDQWEGAFFGAHKMALQLDAIASQMGLSTDGDTSSVVASLCDGGHGPSLQFCLAALWAGATVALPGPKAFEDLPGLKPTFLIADHPHLESMGKRYRQRLERAPDILKKMASDDGDNAWIASLGSIGERAAKKFLYDPIRREFGPRLKGLYIAGGQCPVGLSPILAGADITLLGFFWLPEAGLSHVEHPDAHRPDSAGRPIEGLATKILDAKTGEIGELCLRGETLFDNYWAGDGLRKTDDKGWLRTGQLARLESGFLFVDP